MEVLALVEGQVLDQWLAPEFRGLPDAYVPERIELPGGRKAKVRYDDPERPTVAVRIQDLYEVRDRLLLGKGRIPLRIEVLAPNQRPVPATSEKTNESKLPPPPGIVAVGRIAVPWAAPVGVPPGRPVRTSGELATTWVSPAKVIKTELISRTSLSSSGSAETTSATEYSLSCLPCVKMISSPTNPRANS